MTALDDAINVYCGKLVDVARDNVGDLVAAAQADDEDQIKTLTLLLNQAEQKAADLQGQLSQSATDLAVANTTITDLRSQATAAQTTIDQLRARVAELEAQLPTPPTPPTATTLRIGASKGSVGLAEVDKQFGRKAEPFRVFAQAPMTKWSGVSGLPSDGRLCITSFTGDVPSAAKGILDQALKAVLADAPAGQMIAFAHEGDAKTRQNPPSYSQAQWTAAQEHVLALVAAMPQKLIPVPILTFQSLLDGTADTFISAAIRKIPRLVLGFDTYTRGTPSATIPKMVGPIADFAKKLGLPWVIPEIGNGDDDDRALKITAIAKFCAADPLCQGISYWPNKGDAADYTPGPATWKALAAIYPRG
jgi:hypothetical protein